MNLLEKSLQIDRRWIFLLVAAAVTVPLFLTAREEIPLTPEVMGIYQAIQDLPPGSKVIMACDYDPGTAAEIQPMAVTFFRQALSRHLKIIIMGLWPQGPQQADLALQEALRDPKLQGLNPRYGEDYINLGYQSGNEVVIQRMGSSIPAVFPRDYRGAPVNQYPIMEGVKDFSAIKYVMNMSAGDPGTVQWVQFAGDRFHTRIGSGSTAVQAPQIYPYFPRQLTGILGGMKGAAEYEEVTGFRGKGTRFMLSQSCSHVVVVLFIVLGNLAYFVSRRRKRAPGGAAA
jgi:hypothetical protein